MNKKAVIISGIVFLSIIGGILLSIKILNNEDIMVNAIAKENMHKIKIIVNDTEFTASLYSNETTNEIMQKLPMTLNMKDLHDNEKNYYFESPLPTNPKRAGKIEAGDIMLFSNDCFVLFYETFSSNYSYTKIGKIDDPTTLKQAVGDGDVTITFMLEEETVQ